MWGWVFGVEWWSWKNRTPGSQNSILVHALQISICIQCKSDKSTIWYSKFGFLTSPLARLSCFGVISHSIHAEEHIESK